MSEAAPAIIPHLSGESPNTSADSQPGSADHSAESPKAAVASQAAITYPDPPTYFIEALEDSELLLKYAAEIGIELDTATRDAVLDARAAVTAGWNEKIIADLLAALTVLAVKLSPVTAESLRCFQARPTMQRYWTVAIVLAAIIVPFSVASFVTSGSSGLSSLIRSDINEANALAVKLTTQFTKFNRAAGPATQPQPAASGQKATVPATPSTVSSLPPGLSATDAVTELQTFASLIRSIHSRSRQLDWFVLGEERDPFEDVLRQKDGYKSTFQLPVPLPTEDYEQLQALLSGRIMVFQDARQFAQDVMDDVSVTYGAIGNCILPVLYALLGTCAYLLRSYAQAMSTRTFVPSHSDSAHFLIAGIAGGVVGLFNNFSLGQGASLPSLAVAFIVGYSVDVFFSFLEGLIQAFSKARNTPTAPAGAAAGKS